MRIPFPLSLSVGTDIIAYNRLAGSLGPISRGKYPATAAASQSKQRIQRLVHRFLHPLEVVELTRRFPQWNKIGDDENELKLSDSATTRSDLIDKDNTKIYVWLAGRWAAKEAAKKAWGADLISFKDLRTEVADDGRVQIVCQSFVPKTSTSSVQPLSKSPESPPGEGGEGEGLEQVAKLSISHDGEYAMATVIASPLHAGILAALRARKVEAVSNVRGKR